MAIRAPSLDLLRALRSAAHPPLPARCIPLQRIASSHTSTPRAIYMCNKGSQRTLSTTAHLSLSPPAISKSKPPATHDRGPASKEDTQTDFGQMDIFSNTTAPATSIDACTTDGFHLNNGIKTDDGSGVLLLGGEAFTWRPWGSAPNARISDMLSKTGVISISKESLSVLEMLYPKPDLLIIGTGSKLWMLSKESRDYLGSMGIRVDCQDTGNASAAYNLLATERGVEGVGAALLPVGWKGMGKR